MSQAVVAKIPYTAATGEKLVNETFGPANVSRHRTGTRDLQDMQIVDARPLADTLALETNGFILVRHKSKVASFFDKAQLDAVYYPEVETLIKQTSGASRVVIFDHTLRSGDEAEREAKLIREPVMSAHNDYTDWSGPQRVRDLLPQEAEALLQRRFAIIQVWRPITRPIEANPLALADARSIAPEDLLIAERRYPNRVGQTYWLRYNPDHRWFYFPRMRPDEAIVFSWMLWPDKATADAAEKKMMDDPRMEDMGPMPFDGQRLIWGGFSPIFTMGREA